MAQRAVILPVATMEDVRGMALVTLRRRDASVRQDGAVRCATHRRSHAPIQPAVGTENVMRPLVSAYATRASLDSRVTNLRVRMAVVPTKAAARA